MLQGKSALITGSLGGIGFEIAAALARKGCNVLINGFGDDALIQNQLPVSYTHLTLPTIYSV